jgi:hypothetical protein
MVQNEEVRGTIALFYKMLVVQKGNKDIVLGK